MVRKTAYETTAADKM